LLLSENKFSNNFCGADKLDIHHIERHSKILGRGILYKIRREFLDRQEEGKFLLRLVF
jgi:hypothetical protein